MRVLRLCAAVCSCLALACAREPQAGPRNLVLISVDTLRPDLLGAYGYDRPTSPMLDSLAARGTLFETALSPAPWTLPAHASLLTGLYPSHHGVKSHEVRLADETETLAERLAGRGFATAAVVNSHNLSPRYGLHRGFTDFFYVVESERRREPSEVERIALEWLGSPRDERFFLFLHYYDVHSDYRSLPVYEREFARPYAGPVDGTTHQLRQVREGLRSLDPADARNLIDRYAAGIRQLDDGLARLVAVLRRSGRLEDTLLVVTSDHGEEFLEHGGVLHGRTQYEEVLRVPLVLFGPGAAPGLRVPDPVSLVDLVPTLLSLLEEPPIEGLDGIDLAPRLRGHDQGLSERPLFGEADHGNPRPDVTRSLRVGSWKGILDRESGELQVFDLAADPGEQRPVPDDRAAPAQRLRRELEAFMASERAPDASRAVPPLAPDELEQLRALGYF